MKRIVKALQKYDTSGNIRRTINFVLTIIGGILFCFYFGDTILQKIGFFIVGIILSSAIVSVILGAIESVFGDVNIKDE